MFVLSCVTNKYSFVALLLLFFLVLYPIVSVVVLKSKRNKKAHLVTQISSYFIRECKFYKYFGWKQLRKIFKMTQMMDSTL